MRTLLTAETAHNRATAQHTSSVVELARGVGRALGLDPAALRDVALVALLHDVGKIRLPRSLLEKPGRLTAKEWDQVRRHPIEGAEMVAAHRDTAHLAVAVRASHERWDGDGYPDGLSGEQIPLAARITLVCDGFDAMTSDRPYRRTKPLGRALDEIHRETGHQFCPRAARALIALQTPPWRALGPARLR